MASVSLPGDGINANKQTLLCFSSIAPDSKLGKSDIGGRLLLRRTIGHTSQEISSLSVTFICQITVPLYGPMDQFKSANRLYLPPVLMSIEIHCFSG
jgi:hypothetical protein